MRSKYQIWGNQATLRSAGNNETLEYMPVILQNSRLVRVVMLSRKKRSSPHHRHYHPHGSFAWIVSKTSPQLVEPTLYDIYSECYVFSLNQNQVILRPDRVSNFLSFVFLSCRAWNRQSIFRWSWWRTGVAIFSALEINVTAPLHCYPSAMNFEIVSHETDVRNLLGQVLVLHRCPTFQVSLQYSK